VGDDLGLPLDFGSFEIAEPEEGKMEFKRCSMVQRNISHKCIRVLPTEVIILKYVIDF